MGIIRRFFGVDESHTPNATEPAVSTVPPPNTAPAADPPALAGTAHPAAQIQEPVQPADVVAAASECLASFAASVPPEALFPAFKMVETYRRITLEAGEAMHRALPASTAYTLEAALSTYLPNLYSAYARTHHPTSEQTAELLQALNQADREFSTALELVRAGNSIDLETHTLFMRKRLAA